jgi:hypothetical protein
MYGKLKVIFLNNSCSENIMVLSVIKARVSVFMYFLVGIYIHEVAVAELGNWILYLSS